MIEEENTDVEEAVFDSWMNKDDFILLASLFSSMFMGLQHKKKYKVCTQYAQMAPQI